MEQADLYFEIIDGHNLVRIDSISPIKYNSDIDWDKMWLRAHVVIKTGSFSGKYEAQFTRGGFEAFKKELSLLYNNLKGYANFIDIERYLSLKIKGDGVGHFDVEVRASDNPGYNERELNFDLSFDQTSLKGLEHQLELITENYPVILVGR